MGVARGAGMHAVSAQVKQAHLRAVAFGRRVFRKIPRLTPARFDLLYLLRRNSILLGPRYDGVRVGSTQAELSRTLGLHTSTVAKLVKRLVEIGWVERKRGERDRRTKKVRLTPEGLKLVWRVMRRVFRMRFVRRTYEQIFKEVAPKEHVVAFMRRFLRTLRAIIERFDGTGTLWYDYGGPVPPGQHYWDDAGLWERRRWKWVGRP
jgi:DNA-binding MarR family transcriptional regulator